MAALADYGTYVWMAYGVCALLLVAEVLAVRARARRAERVRDGGAGEDVR
ncbi:MAG: heme exporter protein CcmD [Betaproteobacteria bacterium]